MNLSLPLHAYLLVAFGSGLGGAARLWVSTLVGRGAGTAFPWGTLAVNVSGSFLLSFVMQIALATDAISPELRLALTTGFLGGFTTYSTFNYETMALLREGAWQIAAVNLAATLLLCLAAGFAGLAAGRALAGA